VTQRAVKAARFTAIQPFYAEEHGRGMRRQMHA
jgi:hypothetical protein